MIMGQLRALEATGTPAAVRVPGHDDWVLKQTLDAGAQTVMVPMVDTPEQAGRSRKPAVSAQGAARQWVEPMRSGGYGTPSDYPTTANAQICLIVQIESRRGAGKHRGDRRSRRG
jgi:4-hydroxy-2-oxoheptanedioate aldolase